MFVRNAAVIAVIALSTVGCGGRLSATLHVTRHGRPEASLLALTCVHGVGISPKLVGTRLPTLHPELAVSPTPVRVLVGRRLPNGHTTYRCLS